MNNKQSDLNNHLFAELERLSDVNLKGEDLAVEIGRAKAMSNVATQIIANGSLNLESRKFLDRGYDASLKGKNLLEGD